VVGTQ